MNHRTVEQNRSPFIGLLLSGTISLAGNAISFLAIPWYVHQTTGSSTLTGAAAATGVTAYIIGSLLGGTLADRYDRRTISITADIASGVTVLAIPTLAATNQLSFTALFILIFTGALLDAPGAAARNAMIPDIARHANYTLERTNGLIHGCGSLAEVLGPALAGVLLFTMPTPATLVVNGASYFISAAVTRLLIPRDIGKKAHLDTWQKSTMTTGVRFLRKPGAPRLITLTNATTNLIGAPLFTVVMVVYLAEHATGGLSLGAVVAIGGIGMMLGALAFSKIGHRISRRTFFVIGFAAFGAQYWFLAFKPTVIAILLIFLIRGLLTGAYNPIAHTVLQEQVPNHMLAAVYGTTGAIAMVGEPVGLLLGGFITERHGVDTMILISAIAYAVATIAVASSASLKDFRRRDATTNNTLNKAGG